MEINKINISYEQILSTQTENRFFFQIVIMIIGLMKCHVVPFSDVFLNVTRKCPYYKCIYLFLLKVNKVKESLELS